MKYILLLLAALVGCSSQPQSGFEAHCRTCKQCSGGLIDENGEEQSLCDEGFRTFQEDLRKQLRK